MNSPINIHLYEMPAEGFPSFGWNYYAGEALKGHALGVFGSQVNIKIGRLHEVNRETIDLIMADQPHMIGLTMPPGSLPGTDAFLNILSAFSNKPLVVVGQQLPSYYPDELVSRYARLGFDIVAARGEGERAFEGLIRYLKGEVEMGDIPNIDFRVNGKQGKNCFVHTPLSELNYPASFDTVKHILDSGDYESAMIQASRGCQWGRCHFCTRTSFRNPDAESESLISKDLYRWDGFNLDRVFAEIETLINMGVKSIEFADDEFTGGRSPERIDRLMEIAHRFQQLQKDLDKKVSFRFFARPDVIYRPKDAVGNMAMRQALEALREAGASRIFVGIEGGDKQSLRYYNRGVTLEMCEEAMEICRDIGFGFDAGYIMFYPEQTSQGILRMSRFFRDNQLISANQWPFRPLVINKGSYLESKVQEACLATKPTDEDLNFMRIPWKFKDEGVAVIFDVMEQVCVPTKALMYALKVVTKKNYASDDAESRFAERVIEQNGLFHLNIMEDLAGHAVNNGLTSANIRDSVIQGYIGLDKLVERVKAALSSRRLVDRGNYLSETIEDYRSKRDSLFQQGLLG